MDEYLVFPPPKPEREKERVAAVRALGLLDTPREERFDDLIELAVIVTGGTAAWFGLIDEERQWNKATRGFERRESSRKKALCSYTILGDQPLVLEDARAHSFFGDHPVVKGDPGVGAYCGFPVRGTERGSRLGTLAVVDDQAREFTDRQLKGMRTIRNEIETYLHLQYSRQKVEKCCQTLDEVIDERQDMFVRMRGRVIDVAGVLRSNAGYVERRTNDQEIVEAVRDIDEGAEKLEDIMDMGEGLVMWSSGQLKSLASDLDELKN